MSRKGRGAGMVTIRRAAMVPILYVLIFAAAPARADILLNVFTNPHPLLRGGTIGFAFAGNKFVGSVQGDGPNLLYSTDLTGGSVALFAPTVSLAASPSGEHFVASSLGRGGFPLPAHDHGQDVYVAEGTGIRHITSDGTSNDVFVSGLASNVRGILFDAIGTFGNDMLVTTDGGHVYRVNSSGVPTLLATIGLDTEGLDVAPLGAGFGSFDGQLIVASEGTGQLRAITPGGTVTLLPIFIPNGPEELTFVPLDLGKSGNPVEGFYGSDYTPDVIKADYSEFNGLQGDIVVTSEFGDHRVTRVHWNGSSFETSVIGYFPHQPEDGIFVTSKILCGNGIVDPGEECDGTDDSACPGHCTENCTCEIPSCAGKRAGTPCGDPSDTPCNHPDVCDGSGNCIPNYAAPGSPCQDDGNVCTDDVCDGTGVCGHIPNTAPCDDGNPCTTADACVLGVCMGRDLTPPAVTCSVSEPVLWKPLSPNHSLLGVGLASTATDLCGGPLPVGVAVFGNEDDETPTGDGVFSPDAKDIAPSSLRLRVERKGDGDGRVYLIVSRAFDLSGNIGVACCTEAVPLSQSAADIASVTAQAAAAQSFCVANNGAPPPGYVVVGDGSVIGPKQ